MQITRLIFTVIIALILMGCPPPVSDNPDDSASAGNAPPPGDPEPKAIVVKQVSAGAQHSMIIKTDDTLWAVGDNTNGQLGDGTLDDRSNPVQVKTAAGRPMTNVKQVSAGSYHNMILMKDDTLWAVGNNWNGQLGDDTIANKKIPVAVKEAAPGGGTTAMTEVAQISTGKEHSMIVKKNNTLWAVGNNLFWQLGDGAKNAMELIPIEVLTAPGNQAMTEVDQVSVGDNHSMIVKKNDTLWAVGWNNDGQLGDGTDDSKLTPVQVKEKVPGGEPTAMTEVDQVSAGTQHTVILKKNGDVWAVGLNDHGQLGDGSTANKNIPVQVMIAEGEPMTNVDQVSAGSFHTMILKENGDLWAVGNNEYGQLGDGTTDQRLTPVQVKQPNPVGSGPPVPMTKVASVSAGYEHTIIVKRNGTLWTVGRNNKGQLGNGDVELATKLLPVEITVP